MLKKKKKKKQRSIAYSRRVDVSDSSLEKRSCIKCYMFNARSIRNKLLDLETLAAAEDYPSIGVAESFLDTENGDFLAEYNLSGYSLFSGERNNRLGGGVVLYVKTSLQVTCI